MLSLLPLLLASPALASEAPASQAPTRHLVASTQPMQHPALGEFPLESAELAKRKRPWLAAGLNWFLPGAGYIYNGQRPALGATFLVGAVGLTVVEQSHAFFGEGLKTYDPKLFNLMFASVLVMNTGFAIDAFREAKQLNTDNGHPPKRQARLAPALMPTGEEELAYGLVLQVR